ncbi:TIGR02217 family protein [Jannaschia sp. KMU-145]|uniref:phage distal tail protein, Rcc01695 family n=1 Tax=Jannaschia halovivens TaxID=3388667 RepID=UPI00396B23D9
MSFHEIRFPARLSFGSVGGPERLTEVVTLANGHEERNTPWAHSRRRYDAGVGLRSLDDVGEVIAFFEARRGRLHGFRWKDWADFKSCQCSADVAYDDQVIGVGDGETTQFALMKTYRSGTETYGRPIDKPVPGTVRVGVADDELVDTVHYEVDATTGIITFATAPDIGVDVQAGFEFDVPVRFDTDLILTSVETFRAGEVPDVPVIEVRA